MSAPVTKGEPKTIGDHGGSLDEYRQFLALRSMGAVFVAFLPEHNPPNDDGKTFLFVAVDMRDHERIGLSRAVAKEALSYGDIATQAREIAVRQFGETIALRVYGAEAT